MGDHQLLKLVHIRHKAVVRVMFVFVVLVTLFNLGDTLQNYHNQQKYNMSYAEFISTKKQAAKNKDDFYVNKSYSDYLEDQHYLIKPMRNHLYVPSLVSRIVTIISYVVPLLFGLVLAGMDQASSFNAAVFKSRFKRKQLFATRYWYGLSCLLGATTLGVGITLLGYFAGIPATYVGISWLNVLGLLMTNLAVNSFMFTAGVAVGSIFASLFGMFVFGLLGGWIGMSAVQHFLINTVMINHSYRLLRSHGDQFFLFLFVVAFVASAAVYWITRWLFDRISLENEGEILLLPKLRWVIFVYALIVVPYNFGNWLFQNELLSYSVSIACIVALGFWWMQRERAQEQMAAR
ncbi:hypothetical protein BVJ53_03990 [Lacticaseibacillus chiayiensis]|uniref:ABC transporter permease n=1 Tax=Lacticaseibacillus chiayiensis TaxID=2100821 RepID=A0A4Q1U9W5_9LACO|nr:hypothetical protein [Lacticaseibacillus chiayiensis]QVI34091.1 hypothetical protein KG086_09840 [Lacticaseibacillus chiayiensis]RXT27777.1 hypothetical protein BVJ53_03990 [Lacticaseibacillus chiayiensis]UYN55869.1 hypothetical protein OFW50_10315 [Lacticaseibacillus chiayiensis]